MGLFEIIFIVAGVLVGAAVGFGLGIAYRKKVAEREIGSAEMEATRLINDAIRSGESRKKEMLLEAKDEIHKSRTEHVKERRAELSKQERRLEQKEATLDKKTEAFERKEEELSKKLAKVTETQAQAEQIKQQQLATLEEISGLTQEQAAKRVGKSRPAVANSMRLLSLPQDVLAMVERGELSAGHARTILALENAGQITALANEIVKKNLSVRETERAVKALLKGDAKKEKRVKKRDTYYDEVELAVSQALGRKAKVSLSAGNKGTLEIEFFGKEDLSKLMKLFENE